MLNIAEPLYQPAVARVVGMSARSTAPGITAFSRLQGCTSLDTGNLNYTLCLESNITIDGDGGTQATAHDTRSSNEGPPRLAGGGDRAC